MSSVPYADLGEASENRSGSPTRDHSDDDEINEKGDIGVTRVSDNVYASYQKSDFKSNKGRNELKRSKQSENDDTHVNVNTTPRRRHTRSQRWYHHPKVRENWKTVAGALFLLVIGMSFLICGIVLSAIPKHDGPKAVIFFVCAAVCILPGGYHTVYIYRATKGWRGYTFESLPSFR
ncbi:transmembrane protein 134-like [Xenia sp. Carnegie-2017]|uniref:transmembrane protein 134-like n=1 Tax=Xenia sp. Carnegie-2017 TaxID=2897299 RepID=UPI001F03D8F3|nr:transmembrane protein 134-like [Xenia sp. Carnegie-2017]